MPNRNDGEIWRQNRLSHETSPYLRQHARNPVHWQPWRADVLAHARETNRPILLSVGYSACHWCHVMAHESFEDDAIANLMNQHFVCIKVDREERPDLDVIYQGALNLMGEQGGWPLTMFLLPGGEAFWGGTYFPPKARYGRAAFPDLLQHVANIFDGAPEKAQQNAAAIVSALKQQSSAAGAGKLSPQLIEASARAALSMIDPVEGGTQGAPKFPQTPMFSYLWQVAQNTHNPELERAVTLTLGKMCLGGIYDHVGGGFSRYSTDEIWLAPHFEKMLYDNALLLDLLSSVWAKTGNELFKTRIFETINWMMRELRVGNAGAQAFATALDADSEGVEGKFYIWTEPEIESVLGNDAPMFKTIYDVSKSGNWHEGGNGANILNRRCAAPVWGGPQEETLKTAREKLLAARDKRIRPGLDDKVLCDLNAMAIWALARAGLVLAQPNWINVAIEAFNTVCEQLGKGDTLYHCRAGKGFQQAVLDDYAHMARAAIGLYEATGNSAYLERARGWVETTHQQFNDADGGGYFMTSDLSENLIVRTKSFSDHAVPSGNAVMADVLVRLYHMCGDDIFKNRAEGLFNALPAANAGELINNAGTASAFDLMENATTVVLVGDDSDGILLHAVAASGATHHMIVHSGRSDAQGATLTPAHPAFGKGCVDGKATAYVCRQQTCGLPIFESDALRKELIGR